MKTWKPLDRLIRAYVAKRYLNLKARDAKITVLFLYWIVSLLKICIAEQTAKQMKDLCLKYEITLGGLKYSQRNVTYNSVG